jgi:maltose O-acetyltransferase
MLVGSLNVDAHVALRNLRRNSIATSSVVPRVVRFLLYRLAGLRIETPHIGPHCYVEDVDLHVKPGTFINRGCYFEGAGVVEIGRDCLIGPECAFLTSRHDISEAATVARSATHLAITIGDHVFIGARALILPGAVIENDVIVGAGAVVTGRCLTGGFYAGVPARLVTTVESLAHRSLPPRR